MSVYFDDEPNDCDGCPYCKIVRKYYYSGLTHHGWSELQRECKYDYCVRDDEEQEEEE